MSEAKLGTFPLSLEPMRVRRTYRGGSGLDRRHGAAASRESDCPEEWLASMTRAVNPGFPPVENEGLSVAVLPGGRALLRDLVEQEPAAMLGRAHMEQYGTQPGVLAKIIDSAERLSIQVHPDKAFARHYFHSDYGKTECWHILNTRAVGGQLPYLLMGFRPDVTREMWETFYRRQDIPAMMNCMHRVVPRPGETWLIRGGMPHAIGPGCTLIEIQEPTDYTLRSEHTQADGTPIPDALIHQGLGEWALMECFHYDGVTLEELRENCCLVPQTVQLAGGSRWQRLVGPEDTPCFAMERVKVASPVRLEDAGRFSILTVLEGTGMLSWASGSMPLERGAQVFLPAGVEAFALDAPAQAPLSVIRCHPPGASPQMPVG